MFTSILESLTDRARQTHRDESGAIALAGLAATLILLMMALIIWDAGNAVRDKIDLQNSADVSAYSQASVKARSMNMLSFTNVAKRSTISLHSTYIAMWLGYTDWWRHKGEQCADCFGLCPPCIDYYQNLPLIFAEGWGDWLQFAGFPFPGVEPRQALMATQAGGGGGLFSNLRTDTYKSEVETLDDYQDYIIDITPWWAWTEGLVRGTRNGATLTTSFPPPDGLNSSGSGWIQSALNSSPNYNYVPGPGEFDELPVEKGSFSDACSLSEDASTTYDGPAPMAEATANVGIHQSRSKEGANSGGFAWGFEYLYLGDPRSPIPSPDRSICRTYNYMMWKDDMIPYDYRPAGNRAMDMLQRSNLVFSYKYTPSRAMDILPGSGEVNRSGSESSKYQFVGSDYTVMAPENATYQIAGFWSMARAEIAFAERGDNSDINLGDADERKKALWRAGWTSRIRPVALPGEWNQLAGQGINLNSAYHAVDPYLRVAQQAGLFQQPPLNSANDTYQDMIFMERATRLLGSQSMDGNFK